MRDCGRLALVRRIVVENPSRPADPARRPAVDARGGVLGAGDAGSVLDDAQVRTLVAAHAASLGLRGGRLLVLVPDGTRSAPLPLLVSALRDAFADAAQLDLLVALGTHPPMSEAQLERLVGLPRSAWGSMRVLNHDWHLPETFASLGTITADEVDEISGGMLRRDVDVRVNRAVLDHDHVLVCGPVFPHEVVGFSGGTKYFFPGISGPEVIDVSHWLGALITAHDIIGSLGTTPVRALIDRAASMLPVPTSALSFVVAPGSTDLHALFAGDVRASWAAAAGVSAQAHVRYVAAPFSTVVSVVPPMYGDLWVAAKAMYKVEPVVADGGEVIVYAPHLSELSVVHGDLLREIGYHTRDYFLAHWERFCHVPLSVLSHSTHLRGPGSYDAATGVERPRIRVTLASQLAREECEALGLGYRDPTTVDPETYAGRERDGVLLVRRAGEQLYRVRGA